VAGAFLRPALQLHPHESRAGLRQTGRGLRCGGPAGDPARGGGAGAATGTGGTQAGDHGLRGRPKRASIPWSRPERRSPKCSWCDKGDPGWRKTNMS
jgi:hypothetical protein